MMHWHWPQWVMGGWMLLSIFLAPLWVGKTETATAATAVGKILRVVLIAGLLTAGGFWA